MRALPYLYQFWGLFIYCWGVPNPRKQWSASFVPKTATLSTFNNIPWLLTIDETCQGVILNQWWILSTISCLTKLKYVNSDISKVVNKEGILHGDKICLHPLFNPRDGKYSVEGAIGMSLLEVPIKIKEIFLPQYYNILRKSCFPCVYQRCSVYQYQKHTTFENNVKKLSVKVLDISFCRRQHNRMPRSNKLCIWNHQKEDCWIQQGSPVLCTFGSHWELVGLISESSMACENPILVIKTAPYLPWMRWLVNMNEKLLDPILSSLCSSYPGVEHDLRNDINRANISSGGLSLQSLSRLITSSQNRQRRNPPPVFSISNNRDSFPSTRQLYFQGDHLSSASKFPMAHPWTTIFKTFSTSKQDVFCSNHISNHFECAVHSEAQIPKVTYTSSKFPQRNGLIYQNEIIASLLRHWADLIDAETVFHTMSINSVRSLILFSKQIDGFQGITEIYSLTSQIKPSTFPFRHQFVHGPWLHITPVIGSWTQIHTMSYKIETVIWIPFYKEITQTQSYYIAEKLSTGTYLVTYSLYPWDSLLVDKIEMLTHSILNDYGSHYSSLTPKLGPDFYNLVRSQLTTTKLDGYLIYPVPMRILHPSTLTISYSLSLSKSLDSMSWGHYKPSYVISSSQLDASSLLSKHEDTIVKPLKQTENTAWPLFHSNNIRPLIYSKTNLIHPWAQTDSELLKLWALSKTETVKYLHTLKADKVRLWLEIKPEEIKPKIYHKSEIDRPRIKTRVTKIKYWRNSRIHTIKSPAPIETKTVVPRNQAEAGAVRYWYWPKPDDTLLNTLTNVNSLHLFTNLQVDFPSSWTEPIGNIEHRKKTELFLLRPWVHSQSHNIIHQTKPEENNVVLFQAQTRRICSHCESPVNHYLSKMKDEKMLPMYQSQMDTFKTWIQRKLQITPSWMKHEDDKAIFFTQNQETPDIPSFHNKMETVLKQTQSLTQLSHKRILSEPELHSLWKPAMADKLRNPVHHEFDTIKSLNELNVGIIKPRVYKEARPLKQWMQAEYAKVNPHKSSKADLVMVWGQAETPVVIDWLNFLEDIATTSINSQFQKLDDMTQSKNIRATRWTQTEAPLPSPWMLPGGYTLTSWTTGESSNLIPLEEPIIYALPLWTQNEPTKKPRSITDTLIYWPQTKISATRKPLRNKTEPGSKAQPNGRNSLAFSESYLTSLWTKDHFPTLNSSVEFQSKIGTVWISDEYSIPSLWKQNEVDGTQLTYAELPLETLWTHQVPDTTIFNFTNSPSLINLMNTDYDIITTWSQAKIQSVNPRNPSGRESVTPWTVHETSENNLWSQTKSDINSPQFQTAFSKSLWTQAKVISELAQNNNETISRWNQIINDFKKAWNNEASLAVTSFTEMETDIFTRFIRTESPTTNPWTQHGSDRVTLWNQPMYPTWSQWAGSIPPTATVWLNSNSPFANLWLQQISDRLILSWPHVQAPSLNLQSQSVTYTVIPQLIQAEYAPISLWRKPETDLITAPWPQPELSNQETQPLSDTKLQPWSEPELIPKYQWIITGTHSFIPQWSQYLFSTINMRSPLIFDTLLISTAPWSLKQTLETNLRTLPVYEKKTTARFQSEYSIANTLILSMTDKVLLHWSHSKVPPIYLWRWPISDTMMQSWTQDEYSVKNQWSQFLFDAITSSLSLDNSPTTMQSQQVISDAFVLSRIQVASPKVNLFGLQLPDSIILPGPQSIYSSVNTVGYSGPDKIVPLWPKVKYSQTKKKTSSESEIIMSHLFHEATWEGNRRPWNYHDRMTPTWTQIGSPKLSVWTLIDPNREPSNVSPSENIFSSHSAVITAQSWPYTRSPIFSIWLLGGSVTISPLHPTESTAGNIWPFPLSDTITTMLTHSVSLPVYLWTELPSNTIPSTWPHPEPAKLWTLPIFNRNKPTLFQTESKKLNTQTLFVSNTYIPSWDLSKYQTLIPWTGKIANVLSQWTKSGILIVNSLTEPASYTTQNYVLTPEVKHRTHLISDPVSLRNQTTSPTTNFWKKYGANAFTEWAISQLTNIKHPTQSFPNILRHVEISTTDPWTKVETYISQMFQPNSSNRNIWSQIIENTVTSLFQSVSLISIPWTKFQSNTIRMKNPSDSSALTYWTQSISDQVIPWSQTLSEAENPTLDMRGTETLWKFPEVVVLKYWNKSTTDVISQWITDKSSEIHVFPTAMFDRVILFDHAENPLLSQWTETAADTVIWREAKNFKKYVQTNSHHKIVTKWVPSEFSDKTTWTAPETGTAVGWQQGVSKSFIPRKEYIAKIVKGRIQTQSSAINHFANLVAKTLTMQTQGELTAINVDMQHVFDKLSYITEPKYLLTESWIQKENVAFNTREISENHWVQPATETVRLCIYTVYSTFNSLLQTKKLVTGWSQANPQKRKNHWDKDKLSNIIHFTQNEYLSTYPCISDKIYKFMPGTQIQYIPEYHLAEAPDSKVVSWSETDSLLTNMWREAMLSKVMYSNQFPSLPVNPSTRKRASVLIQKEFATEDTWLGSSTPNGIHWIQEESSLEQSETVSLTSIAVNWTQSEHVPVVPWTQSMGLRYPLINKLMLSSYNHIIWTHPRSGHATIPMSSLSKTLTPLALDENHLKNHWTESQFENLITLTKFLSVSEKLLTEDLFSTVLPWKKLLFSLEITSMHSNFDAITPRAMANISRVISTCTLSDNHICISRNHNEFLKSKFKLSTSSIVKQNFQSESPLDLLEPKVSSRFTAWRLGELLLQTDATVILSTTVAQTQTESLGSEIWSEIVTNNKTSLNSTEFIPVYFYMHNGIDKTTIFTVAEIEGENVFTVSTINNFRISMQTQPYATKHSSQTALVPWASTETLDRNTWSFSELGSLLSWRVPVPSADFLRYHTEYHIGGSWFETNVERKRPWVQPYYQTITTYTSLRISTVESWVQHKMGIKSWMNSATVLFNGRTQFVTENVRLWNVPKNNTVRPWFHAEASTDHPWFHSITNRIIVLTQTEYQEIGLWTVPVSDILASQAEIEPEASLHIYDTDVISYWFPIPNSLSQRIKLEPGTVTPWIQKERQIIVHPWNRLETKVVKTGYNVETNTFQIILTYSKSGEIIHWIQPESPPVVRRWPVDVTLWTLTKSDENMPWSQLEYKSTQYLLRHNFGRIKLWFQHKAPTETLETIPWIHSDIVLSNSLQTDVDDTLWSLTQRDAIRQLSQVEYKAKQSLTRPDISITNLWIQHKDPSETLEVVPWTHSDTVISDSIQAQIDFWSQNLIDAIRQWSQVKYKAKQSLTQPDVGIFTPSIQYKASAESLEIISWTHSDTVTSDSIQTQIDFWSQNLIDAIRQWSQVKYKAKQSLTQPDVGIFTPSIQYKASAESLEIISWTHSDTVTSDSIQTQIDFWSQNLIDAIRQWSQVKYKAKQSLTQPDVGIFTPSIQYKASAESLEIISWIHSDTVIADSIQTVIDSALWTLIQTDFDKLLSQVEWENIQSLVHQNVGIIHSRIQHKDSTKTLDILSWIHSHRAISYPLQTVIDSALWTLTQTDFDKLLSQVEWENIQSLVHQNVGIIHSRIQHKDSTKTLDILSWIHSHRAISYPLQTVIDSALWTLTQTDFDKLLSQVEWENIQSLVHQNVGIIHSRILPKDSTKTLDIFSWIYSHRATSYPLQTQIDLFRLWNTSPPMTAQIWNPTVEEIVKPDALTAVFTVSPSFNVQEMLFTEEPTLILPPQSDPQDTLSLEPLLTRQAKLNISLSECHLSIIWNDKLQTLWLYKTAVVSHDTTECGIRPGLVPYCPDCWEAEIGEFPWMVSMQLSYAHFCAGSILNEMWVLTSARCANFIKRSESLAFVQVGLVDLQDPTQGETVGIQRSLPYLSPRGPLGPGLIFLKEPIHFQPLVFPICLEESQEQERHIQLYDCWLPSWSLMRGSPGILQKRHLSIMQVSTCAKFWPQLNEFTFCVKAKKAMGESGCKGDLGAPLVCHLKQKDIWMQVGILIDFDEHCTKPYVFSQVSPFIFWLQRVTQPSHAPWSPERPVNTSPLNSLSVSTSRKDSTFTSLSAAVHPHFISLPQPQALADHISVQYALPWQAIIFSCGNQICSGSIISSYWVLTAAHCVRNMNPENTLVILGLRHHKQPLRVVKVTTILLHEKFRLVSRAARNDLALVLLREGQSSIHIMAPLGSIKDLNTSECWLSGSQILKPGYIFENLDMLQIQVMGASKCTYLYPDIGSSTVCYNAQAGVPVISIESMSPGSAVICRPLYGNRKWRQIGFTSLKHLATIVAPHFSWILSSTAKSGYPLDEALIPWVENSKSYRLEKHPTTLLLSIIMIISMKRMFIL